MLDSRRGQLICKIGLIEHLAKRQPQVALGDQINRTAIVLALVRRDGPLRRSVQLFDQILLDWHNHAFAAGLEIQAAGHREHRVPHFLGAQPPPRELPEQAILRIVLARADASGDRDAWRYVLERTINRCKGFMRISSRTNSPATWSSNSG